MKKLNFFNSFVYYVNVLCALLLVLGSIKRHTTWDFISFLSFLSLMLPYLVAINFVFLIYWMLQRRRQLVLSLVVLVVGFLSHGTFIKVFNVNAEVAKEDISVLSFNSHGSRGLFWTRSRKYGNEIAKFIKDQDSDIVSFQEFDARSTSNYEQYPYKFVNYKFSEKRRIIQAIFSKYPIIKKGTLDFPESNNNAIYADILIEQDTVRVYNLHLQSFRIRAGFLKTKSPKLLFGRVNHAFRKQQEQVYLINNHKESITHKIIISGDFNNTQFSSIYHTLKGDMTDSFLEHGSGLGTTYSFKFLPFRIDFLLFDEDLEVRSHKNYSVKLSDHKPVMASFRFRN